MADYRSADPAARSRFGPAVVGGLVAGGAAAVAGNQDWVSLDDAGSGSGDAAFASTGGVDLTAPPVTATALVLLAAWGVVLVTRGRFRRAVAWLGLAAALAVLGFAVAAWVTLPGRVADDLPGLELDVGRTWWSHLAVGAGAVATSVLAVRGVRRWPEMGRRYDAPADAAASARAVGGDDREQTSLDLWRAMDEGHDPTQEGPH